MPVTFPVHTNVFIIALMVMTGVGAWLLLSQGLDKTGVPVEAREGGGGRSAPG